MPKVTEAHRQARRSEIAAAALRCFAAKGFRGTSMSDIIAASGLSAGAIYGHYASKEELFFAAAQQVLSARSEELEGLRADHGPLAPGEVIVALIDGMRGDDLTPDLFLQVWAEAAIDPAVRAMVREYLAPIRGMLHRLVAEWAAVNPGLAGGDPEAYATRTVPVLMGLAPGFMVQRAVLAEFDEEAYLATVRTLVPR
ncbi:TetR/AcrR family transcriptional regulator [Agromyces aurantiacus]|uniref:TetR/AcrR family transcriptional regulator n=1 Tax=Agromyces aurantiacus TaxID=165814 RepID=A0ABV9R0Z9_9MICO|nr:TetR/AcrR family transcriptional regulator [Agromyces aurantiacus]MBM7505587.1 AcrR family transcriptional regulator [Agromyces aurantiacus]